MTDAEKEIWLLVPEYSWWKSLDGKRLFFVADKSGRDDGTGYRPTRLAIAEKGFQDKNYVPYDTFAKQVVEGKLLRVGIND